MISAKSGARENHHEYILVGVVKLFMFKVSKIKNHKNQFFNILFLGPLLLSVLLFAQSAQAAKTKKKNNQRIERCQNLSKELKTLKSDEAVKNMSKGFEWVKANMDGEALLPIKQYLEISEEIKFQCPQPKRKKPITKNKPKSKKAKSVNLKQVKSPDKKRKKTYNPQKTKQKKKKNKTKKNKNTKVETVSPGDLTSLFDGFFSGPGQPANKKKP